MDVTYADGYPGQSLYIPGVVERENVDGKLWQRLHVNTTNGGTLKKEVEGFLAKCRPRFDGVHGAVSGGLNYYVWARSDGDGPPYELNFTGANGDWSNILEREAAAKRSVIVGFNNAPNNGIWYLVAGK